MTILLHHWVGPYGIMSFLSTNDVPLLVAKLFRKVCPELKVQHIATTWFHSQTSGLVYRFNKTLGARL